MKNRQGKSYIVRLLIIIVAAGNCFSIAHAQESQGSVLRDNSDPAIIEKYRNDAREKIVCQRLQTPEELSKQFTSLSSMKWDRAKMGCGVSYGAALAKADPDNVELQMAALGANIEYFSVLLQGYSDHYQSIELSSELAVRWETARNSAEAILLRLNPYADDVVEVRVLRAAYWLLATQKGAAQNETNEAIAKATVDLETAIATKPEVLDGLGLQLLAQILLSLPEFLGGDSLRAIELLEKARAVNPNSFAITRTLIEAYLGERRNAAAIDLLETALEIDAGDDLQSYVDETLLLGGMAVRVGQEELGKAYGAARDSTLKLHPYLQVRKSQASLGHGGVNPITGEDPDALN